MDFESNKDWSPIAGDIIALLALVLSIGTIQQQSTFQDEQRVLWEENKARFQPKLSVVEGSRKQDEGKFTVTVKNDSSVACAITHYRFIVQDEGTLERIAQIVPRSNAEEPAGTVYSPTSLDNLQHDVFFQKGMWAPDTSTFEFYREVSENLPAGGVANLSFAIGGQKWKSLSGPIDGKLLILYDSPSKEPMTLDNVRLNVLPSRKRPHTFKNLP